MLHKVGVTQKIKTVAANETEFERLKEQIVTSNNLARCNRCGKLLAKVDSNMVSVKRKDIDLVAEVKTLTIKCPVCQTVNDIVGNP